MWSGVGALEVRTLWQVGWGHELQRRRCRSHGGSILSCSDGPDFVFGRVEEKSNGFAKLIYEKVKDKRKDLFLT